jgi:hypothetical protein
VERTWVLDSIAFASAGNALSHDLAEEIFNTPQKNSNIPHIPLATQAMRSMI